MLELVDDGEVEKLRFLRVFSFSAVSLRRMVLKSSSFHHSTRLDKIYRSITSSMDLKELRCSATQDCRAIRTIRIIQSNDAMKFRRNIHSNQY